MDSAKTPVWIVRSYTSLLKPGPVSTCETAEEARDEQAAYYDNGYPYVTITLGRSDLVNNPPV